MISPQVGQLHADSLDHFRLEGIWGSLPPSLPLDVVRRQPAGVDASRPAPPHQLQVKSWQQGFGRGQVRVVLREPCPDAELRRDKEAGQGKDRAIVRIGVRRWTSSSQVDCRRSCNSCRQLPFKSSLPLAAVAAAAAAATAARVVDAAGLGCKTV